MRTPTFRRLLLLLTFASFVGCRWDAPVVVAPGRPDVPLPSPIPLGTAMFPPLSKSGVIYNRVTASFVPGKSRYVIYDDGTFSLQYVGVDSGFAELVGRYSRPDSFAASLIKFSFNDWDDDPWVATGAVSGDSMVVHYGIIMALSDFEDGVYRWGGRVAFAAPNQK
jgi:hypothetical protein